MKNEAGVTFSEYRQIKAVHWTTLREMAKSPAHYLHRYKTPREDTPDLLLGRAVHAAILEPERFESEFVIWDGAVRRGKDWEAFKAQNQGKEILKDEEHTLVLDIRKSVLAHPVAKQILSQGVAEETITWTDRETSLPCKGRIDWHNGGIVDLKTARSADPRFFGQEAARLKYPQQMAFYSRGLTASGRYEPSFPVKLLVVEKEEPFDVSVLTIPSDVLTVADQEVSRLLKRLKECVDENKWPGRAPEETTLEVPGWFFTEGYEDDTGLGLIINGKEV